MTCLGHTGMNATPGTHRFIATPALRTGRTIYAGVVGVNLLVVALALSPLGTCLGASSAGIAGTVASAVLLPVASGLIFVAYRRYPHATSARARTPRRTAPSSR